MATFKDDWVGRLTDFDGRYHDTPDQNQLIQHGGSLCGGTSGSPMFRVDGKVVAVSSSTLGDEPTDGGPTAVPSASEIAFAIRIDAVQEFI